MKNYFGKDVAKGYDNDTSMSAPSVADPAVDFLKALAGKGAALELGIGTGRIALPLSQKGVSVHGIDLSPDMLEQLKVKPGGASTPVTLGDFSTTKVKGYFQLVFLVFNTITNLTTQEAQVQCFQNAADHLVPGGCFVIETFIPALRMLPPGAKVHPYHFTASKFDFDEYNVATQELVSHHMREENGVFHDHAIPFRYV